MDGLFNMGSEGFPYSMISIHSLSFARRDWFEVLFSPGSAYGGSVNCMNDTSLDTENPLIMPNNLSGSFTVLKFINIGNLISEIEFGLRGQVMTSKEMCVSD